MSDERLVAAERFLDDWSHLIPALPYDYGCTFTCSEAEALEALLRAFGRDVSADEMMIVHAASDDDCEDRHHQRCADCPE